MKNFKGISLLIILGLVLTFANCGGDDSSDDSLTETELVRAIINGSREQSTNAMNRTIVTIPATTSPIEGIPGLSGEITFGATFDDQTMLGTYNIGIDALYANFKIKDVTINGILETEATIEVTTINQTMTQTITQTTNGNLTAEGDKVSGTITYNDLETRTVLDEKGKEKSFEVLSGSVFVNEKDVTSEI